MIFLNSQLTQLVLILLMLCPGIQVLAEQPKIDFVDIQQQALLSSAAYLPENRISQSALPAGYSLELYHNIADIQISFFLVSNADLKSQTIAIRGTSNVENAMVDLTLKLVLDKTTNLYLHQGFADAARQVFSELKPFLKDGYQINTTGHSLGGAVALILAAMLEGDGFKVNQVVTFGQPKVTNFPGAAKFQHLKLVRVVTPEDLVPLAPLFDPLDINNLDIYWHAGKEVILLDGNQYAILEGVNSMLRATRFTQQPLNEANLRHHQMQVYLQRLEAKLETAEEVAYEISFNLFNLFGNE